MKEVAMNLDDRLREASRALQDGSVTQVDAATRLREIIRHSDVLAGHSDAPPPPAQLRRRRQRLALVVNLLLVAVVGVLAGFGLGHGHDAATTAPPAGPPAQPASTASAPPRTVVVTRTQVPEACLEIAELADEIISRLNRNIRDNRLAVALVEYSEANQRCRREATP